MKSVPSYCYFEATCETGDAVDIRLMIQPFGKDVIYVDVNGVTVVRIGHIDPDTVKLDVGDDHVLNKRGRDGSFYSVDRRKRNR